MESVRLVSGTGLGPCTPAVRMLNGYLVGVFEPAKLSGVSTSYRVKTFSFNMRVGLLVDPRLRMLGKSHEIRLLRCKSISRGTVIIGSED
jgi:hypothetical protein